jgi:hypothetical protein
LATRRCASTRRRWQRASASSTARWICWMRFSRGECGTWPVGRVMPCPCRKPNHRDWSEFGPFPR